MLQIFGVHSNNNGIVGGDNYGTDFLFHISIGNSLVYSGWPPKLLYANYSPNVFPFISDFFMSILIFNGINPVVALYMMNLLLYFSIAVSLAYFISIIIKNKVAAVFGVILFLFCSVGANMILIYIFHINLPYFSYSIIQNMGNNPIGIITFPLMNFADPLENNFAPQHDYVFAFPLIIMIITVLYIKFLKSDKENKVNTIDKPLLFIAVIIGLLPLTHPYG